MKGFFTIVVRGDIQAVNTPRHRGTGRSRLNGCESGGVYMYSGGHIASCGQQIMRTVGVDLEKHLVEAARRGNTLESGNLESFSFCEQV